MGMLRVGYLCLWFECLLLTSRFVYVVSATSRFPFVLCVAYERRHEMMDREEINDETNIPVPTGRVL
jgi:hypothetical protein